MKAWYDNLRRSIKDSGYTQQQIAERLGVTQPTVSNWLRGHAVPSINTMHELSKILEMSLSEMLGQAAIFIENTDERDLIVLFRELDTRDRAKVMKILAAMRPETSG